MIQQTLPTIVLCALVTIAVRTLPALLLSRVQMPGLFRDWLAFIPAAIMTAIIATQVLYQSQYSASGWNITLLATVGAGVVGWCSKSLFATVLAGVAAFLALEYGLA